MLRLASVSICQLILGTLNKARLLEVAISWTAMFMVIHGGDCNNIT
jgi:hypothetical protein